VTAVAALYEGEGGRLRRARIEDFADLEGRQPVAMIEGGGHIEFERLLVAAGVWSKALAERLGSRVPLESERGYNTTLPDPRVYLEREVIFAERKFVVTPMAMGLRVGGAAEFAGLEAPPNFARSRALLELAMRYLPGLNGAGGRAWMGHRPALPDSLPIIGRSPHHPNAFFAFGHGHLGLTMAATTARLLSALVQGADPGLDLRPFRVDRF
jgi:D-amino-acid dehydrogenase